MRDWLRDSRRSELAIAFAAGAAILCASLANFLSYNAYPYFRPEVGLVAGTLLLVAAIMAPFYCAQRQWGRSVLEGLLAALFVDLNSSSLALALAAGAAVAIFTFWWRRSLAGPMAVLATFILLMTALGVGRSPGWIRTANAAPSSARSSLPKSETAIVHIILDEHIGIGGLPLDDPDAAQLRRELQAFYRDAGFVVYRRAYSQFMHTGNAIPHILNFGRRLAQRSSHDGVIAGPSEYLQDLIGKGYSVTVFQSDFADFCEGMPEVRCVTYDASSLRPVLATSLASPDRAGLIAYKFLGLSELAKFMAGSWNASAFALRTRGLSMPTFDPENAGRSSSMGSLAAFDDLVAITREARPGDAYFVHILLPHYPYVVRPDCSFLPWREWKLRRSETSIGERRRAYYDQVRCTMRRVDLVLDSLSKSPARSNAVVIIHGDHGSRITRVDPEARNIGQFDDSDTIAGFSTIFAIKAPGLRPTYIDEPAPVANLLWAFTMARFRYAPAPQAPARPMVYLDEWNWKAGRSFPLPNRWVVGDIDHPAAAQATEATLPE